MVEFAKISAAEPTWIPLINHEPSNWSPTYFACGLSHQDSTCGTLPILPSVLHRARQDIVWTSLLLQLQKANNALCCYPTALDLLFPDWRLMNIKLTKLTSVTLLLHSRGASSPEIHNKVAFEICTLLGFDAAYNVFPFRVKLSVPLEEAIDRVSRNVGSELPFYAAKNPSRVQISFTPKRRAETTLSHVYLKI